MESLKYFGFYFGVCVNTFTQLAPGNPPILEVVWVGCQGLTEK
jgi:hypothetical protein